MDVSELDQLLTSLGLDEIRLNVDLQLYTMKVEVEGDPEPSSRTAVCGIKLNRLGSFWSGHYLKYLQGGEIILDNIYEISGENYTFEDFTNFTKSVAQELLLNTLRTLAGLQTHKIIVTSQDQKKIIDEDKGLIKYHSCPLCLQGF